MERTWKLGDDLSPEDNLLDPITFESVILDLRCGCKHINALSAIKTVKKIMEERLQDMEFLLENNMEEIIAAAREGREG